MRKWLFLTLVAGTLVSACNAILGNHVYRLADSDAEADAEPMDSTAGDGRRPPPNKGDGGGPMTGDAKEPSDGVGTSDAPGVPPDAGCSPDAGCAPGLFCADGVCCDKACTGSCEACNLPMLEGTCSPVAQGEAAPSGHAACSETAMSMCGTDGKCDGKGACELWPDGTECASGSCNAATNQGVGGSTCDGKGACKPTTAVTCAPFMCADGGAACAKTCTTMSDCVGQPCVNDSCGKVANGSTCTTGAQCTSGNCVDGFCCNSSCTASCQACDLSGVQGTCTTLTSGAPHGMRAACAGSGTCKGSCTGGTSCTYPTATCAVQTCTAGAELLAASCNGAGACAAQATTSCNGFACNGASCYTSCSGDGQCAAAMPYCNASTSACQATAPLGHACSGGSQCASGLCCGSTCVDATLSGNCHGCGVTCAVGATCQSAGCACPAGQAACGGACVSISTTSNCGGCGVVCSNQTGSPTCNGTTCSYACGAGRLDCNASSAPDTDGCECATPACCGSSCQTLHSTGLPSGQVQQFYDCTAAGAYSQTLAMDACNAVIAGTSDTCFFSGGSYGIVTMGSCPYTAVCGASFCWIYLGPGTGTVITVAGGPLEACGDTQGAAGVAWN